MAKVRKIGPGSKTEKNFYLVDANFLANYAIPHKQHQSVIRTKQECDRISACMDWWEEINGQVLKGNARVYIPDICIAEAFKALAKKYYQQNWWPSSAAFNESKRKLGGFVSTTHEVLQRKDRKIGVHDVATTRDVLISVKRYHEAFLKKKIYVEIGDLILASTAKYLMDFFDIPFGRLHIVTCDKKLLEGINTCAQELPSGYDPTTKSHSVEKVFI